MTYALIGWAVTTIVLGIICQFYKVRAEALAKEVLDAHDWVDEIIEALENPPESGPDERLDGLVAERRPL
jgi:hypothetical protein